MSGCFFLKHGVLCLFVQFGFFQLIGFFLVICGLFLPFAPFVLYANYLACLFLLFSLGGLCLHYCNLECIDLARGCTGCTCTPSAEKKFWAKFTGGSCECTPDRECTSPQVGARVHFLRKLGRAGWWERLLKDF